MTFMSPLWLVLLPLALLPFFVGTQQEQSYPSFYDVPEDALSRVAEWILRGAGVLAIAGLIVGNAGIALKEQSIERIGEGAHIVLLIDRSSSMDNTFAGQQASGSEESKSAAARRLLKDFVGKREHDRFGIAAFSTAPMVVLPLTDHKNILFSAIDAMDRPGLAFTDVGRGLSMALHMQAQDTSHAVRALDDVGQVGAVSPAAYADGEVFRAARVGAPGLQQVVGRVARAAELEVGRTLRELVAVEDDGGLAAGARHAADHLVLAARAEPAQVGEGPVRRRHARIVLFDAAAHLGDQCLLQRPGRRENLLGVAVLGLEVGADVGRQDRGIAQHLLPARILQPGKVVLDGNAVQKTRGRTAFRDRRLCHAGAQA